MLSAARARHYHSGSGRADIVSASHEALREESGTFLLSQISNEMVRLYKYQFGRGPVRARTHWCGSDAITVLLEDTLTPAERNLVKLGEHARLRDTRTFFQYSTAEDFCEPIERLTGRRVRAFISGIDTEADGLSVETFVLHPDGSDMPSRRGA
jgi:uncharacterized protein YbcI